MYEEITNVDWLILTMSLLSYFFIFLAIIKKEGKGQSFFTWIMWLILDIILLIPTLSVGGKSSLLLFGSTIGSMTISFFLLKLQKGKIGWIRWFRNYFLDWLKNYWTWSEWLCLSLIILTSIVWAISTIIAKDSTIVIVCAVVSQVIAGIPLTIKSWQEPKPEYILGYLFFILGCILTLVLEGNAFESFSSKDHLFPIALGIQTIVDTIPLVKKKFKKTNDLNF